MMRALAIGVSIGLLAANLAFFYLFAIGLDGVFLALGHFFVAVLLPGYIMALVFLRFFQRDFTHQPAWDTLLPLATIFGLANVCASYLAGQLTGLPGFYYGVVWPMLAFLAGPFRNLFRDAAGYHFRAAAALSGWTLAVFLLFVLILNGLFFLSRATPGLLPLDIFHDHVWNAGHTVSLVSDFPLKSLNVESRPGVGYHILVHILGAHLALVTGLVPHMVGLQYGFVPLVPFLILNMALLLQQFVKGKRAYLFYGLAVLLFGGGFSLVHEVKVNSYLNSNTNFMGIILLFTVIHLMIHSGRYTKTGSLLVYLTGFFLATAAKGSIGASLAAGMLFWGVFQVARKRFNGRDLADIGGGLTGFAAAYGAFFWLPVRGQVLVDKVAGKSGAWLVPLSYVTGNAFSRPFLDVIYKYVPESFQLPAHAVFTICILPIYLLLYFSYRLLVPYWMKTAGMEENHTKILFVILGSLAITYSIRLGPQDTAYFITSAVFLLDLFFVSYLARENVFFLLADYYRNGRLYGLVGALVILALPFVSLPNWVRKDYAYNFFMYGRIGQAMDAKFSKTDYRKAHQTITPKLYAALQYIRENTPRDTMVVTPFIQLKNGRPVAYQTSTFAERPVYLEGYRFGKVGKYLGKAEIEERVRTVEAVYQGYRIPDVLMKRNYVFLLDEATRKELAKQYAGRVLYDNGTWTVVRYVIE
ncbi:MAG: hypothetical protein ACOZF0_00635 [Thermodesulfobacteriota bacterium]